MPLVSGGMNSAEPAALPDERVLEMAGIKLAKLTGKKWRVEPGPLLRGPGTLGVRLGPHHSDSYRHIDLEFLLNVDRAAETALMKMHKVRPVPLTQCIAVDNET
jgi:hypothetical protein